MIHNNHLSVLKTIYELTWLNSAFIKDWTPYLCSNLSCFIAVAIA